LTLAVDYFVGENSQAHKKMKQINVARRRGSTVVTRRSACPTPTTSTHGCGALYDSGSAFYLGWRGVLLKLRC